jgi:heavy metal sensor kinase
MRPRSFRLKLVLLAAGLSGLVLTAFGVSCWALIYRFSLERLDREIGEWGQRDLDRRQPPGRWARIAGSLSLALGGEADGRRRFIMLVKERDGGTLYVSPDWPVELPLSAFPTPTGSGAPLPPAGERPPPDAAWFLDDAPPAASPRPPGAGSAPGARPEPPPWRPEDARALAGRDRGLGPPPGPPPGPPLPLRQPSFQTQRLGSERWRVGVMGNPEVTLVMGVNLDEFAAGMRRVRNAFVLALPAALLLIAAGSWFLAERALQPIADLTRTVAGVTARGLDQRLAEQGADSEFRQLIAVFNQMLGRLEGSFQQAARFSADAAHELKTPLTVLQGRLEQALQRADAGSAEQRVFGELSEEVQRLKIIVQRLLLLARADAGQLNLQLRDVVLTDLVQSLLEDVSLMAPHLAVRSDLAPGVTVTADADLLRQTLHNLADNAVKYNLSQGWIEVVLRQSGAEARLTLANTAQDIPPAARERLFERFFRADPAHSRQTDGSGLGLSLAREIARAHGGDVVLEKSADGVTAFTLTLPLTTTSPPQ